MAEFLRTFGTEAAERTALTPATKDPAPTAPPPLASPLEYPSASPPAAAEGPARASSRAAETPAEDAATRKSPVISANASEKTTRTDVEKRAETQTTRTAALIPETPPALAANNNFQRNFDDDLRYEHIEVPQTESLADVCTRVAPLWEETTR